MEVSFMFVGIVGVVGVVGGVVAMYDDHSDHSRYSEYSDAAVRERNLKIEELKRKIEVKKKEIENDKSELDRKTRDVVSAFKNEPLLFKAYEQLKGQMNDLEFSNIIKEYPFEQKKEMLKVVEKELEKSVQKDKKRLDDINNAIMRINELQANTIKYKK